MDPVGAGIGVATVLITFILWRKSRSQLRLTHEIRQTPLVALHDEARGRVALTLDGAPVEKPHLIQVRISNSGNAPIRSADFERPLRIQLGTRARTLSVAVIDTRPEGLQPRAWVDEGDLAVDALLLNPGDGFTLKALVHDFDGPAQLEPPRIAGLTQVEDAASPPTGLRLVQLRLGRLLPYALVLVSLGLLLEWIGDDGTGNKRADSVLQIPVDGAPTAITAFSGLLVTSSESGTVTALDPVNSTQVAFRRLGHVVTSGVAHGGELFALGGGRLTRMAPDLRVLIEQRIPRSLSMLAAGPAGLWAAGSDGLLKRIAFDAPTSGSPSLRFPGGIRGLAVSAGSVWATLPGSSQLIAAVSRPGAVVVTRRVDIGCAAGPVTIAGGMAWALCGPERRIIGVGLDRPERRVTIRVGAGATLLASGFGCLWVGSTKSGTVTQYDESGTQIGRPFTVGAAPSSLIVDLNAVWTASKLDHSLQRKALAGLKLPGFVGALP